MGGGGGGGGGSRSSGGGGGGGMPRGAEEAAQRWRLEAEAQKQGKTVTF
jgi:hypothetical protein